MRRNREPAGRQRLEDRVRRVGLRKVEVAERKERYKALQRLLFDKAAYGYLWTQKWNWLMNRRLQGLPPPMNSLWDFRRVYVTS